VTPLEKRKHVVVLLYAKIKKGFEPSKEPEGIQIHETWWNTLTGPEDTGGWSC